jgi:CheY-like chemotaxis protein
MISKVLLVVDDEAELAEALIFVLQAEGYVTRYASNGLDALALLSTTSVDLVLTDYMMPVMDGFELLRTMRATHGMDSTPVLVLSGLPELIVRTKCGSKVPFLRKPYTASQLLERVRELLAPFDEKPS